MAMLAALANRTRSKVAQRSLSKARAKRFPCSGSLKVSEGFSMKIFPASQQKHSFRRPNVRTPIKEEERINRFEAVRPTRPLQRVSVGFLETTVHRFALRTS